MKEEDEINVPITLIVFREEKKKGKKEKKKS